MSQVSTQAAGWSSARTCAQKPTSDQAHDTAPAPSTNATDRTTRRTRAGGAPTSAIRRVSADLAAGVNAGPTHPLNPARHPDSVGA